MFCGITSVNLDPKGRIVLPTSYRTQLQDENDSKLVVTIDTEDRCLLLYPSSAWKEIKKKIAALPTFNKLTRRIQRLLIGHATELELDNNWRFLIPPLLREYAKLDKRVILVGQGKKIEIWDDGSWTSEREEWLNTGVHNTSGGVPTELQSLSL